MGRGGGVISRAAFYGGFKEVASATAITLSLPLARVHHVTPNAANLSVTLPDARTLRTGGVLGWVFNKSGVNAMRLKDNAGTTIATVVAGQLATLLLTDSSTAAGAWIAKLSTPLS